MALTSKQIARFKAIAKAKKNKKLKIEANEKDNKKALVDVLMYAQIDLQNYLSILPAHCKDQKESVQISIDNIDATLNLLDKYDLKLIKKEQEKSKGLER